jgi:hypothetical protein
MLIFYTHWCLYSKMQHFSINNIVLIARIFQERFIRNIHAIESWFRSIRDLQVCRSEDCQVAKSKCVKNIAYVIFLLYCYTKLNLLKSFFVSSILQLIQKNWQIIIITTRHDSYIFRQLSVYWCSISLLGVRQ